VGIEAKVLVVVSVNIINNTSPQNLCEDSRVGGKEEMRRLRSMEKTCRSIVRFVFEGSFRSAGNMSQGGHLCPKRTGDLSSEESEVMLWGCGGRRRQAADGRMVSDHPSPCRAREDPRTVGRSPNKLCALVYDYHSYI